MKKTFKAETLILLCFFLTVFTVFSADQEIPAKINELEQKLNKLKGQEKVDTLNDLSYDYYEHSLEKSLDYGKRH